MKKYIYALVFFLVVIFGYPFSIAVYKYYNSYDILKPANCLLIKSNCNDVKAYHAPDNRFLLVCDAHSISINADEKSVYLISNYGFKIFGIFFWPKDAYSGVVLGDPVKGDEEEITYNVFRTF